VSSGAEGIGESALFPDHKSALTPLDTGGTAPLPARSSLLTAREVAQRLQVSTETVLRWTRTGELYGFRLPGGALRYRPTDLEHWLAERATPRRGSVSDLEGATRSDPLAAVSNRQLRGEDLHAADSARAGVQAGVR
jgi:excisionase family DNA binding protein